MGQRRIPHLGSAILALAIAGAACAERPAPTAAIPDHAWLATVIDGVPADPQVRSTLRIAGVRITGNAGCNRYSGTMLREDGGVRFGPLAATRMACPPLADDQERRFLAALARAERLSVERDLLLLRDANGAPLVVLVPTDRD